MITYDDFAKLDIRIGTVKSAEKIENADKLLLLSVDIGEETPRQLVAGIAEFFAPEELVGKQIPILANLEPRTLRGHESQGMILAASFTSGEEGSEKLLTLLHPGKELPPGSTVG